MKKYVLSERKTKSVAALAGLTLTELNVKAGLGASYMSRKWGKDNIELSTVNKIAAAIGCSTIDLLEETEAQQ